MNDYDDAEVEGTDIDPRTRRALEEPLSVVALDGTPVESSDETVVLVVSGSGESYHVDAGVGRCECPDHQHRDAECKHIRRARIELGETTVDTHTLATVAVDTRLGATAPGPHVATSDGGLVGGDTNESDDDDDETRVATDGGRPDDVRKIDGFASNDPFYKCDRCGGIGDTVEMVDHHEDCPAVATDGGVVDTMADTEAGERVRVPVSGGVLVYESRALGKELVGFENVDDWDTLAGALAAKGHDRGAVFHLPELDE